MCLAVKYHSGAENIIITKKDFVLSVAITASAGDIIRQDTTGAYGVVETGAVNTDLGIEDRFRGGVIDFDGVDDYVEVATSNELKLASAGSISVWIKPNDLYQKVV